MRSAVFTGAGKPLAIEERPVPAPAAGQALIRVERCGICGSDLHMTSGSAFDVGPGTALGHEYAGEVVETGAGVTALRRGDRVTALPMSACGGCAHCAGDAPLHCAQLQSMAGGYSEYTLIDERMAFRLPDSLGYEDGALIEPLACGLRAMRRLAMPVPARVVVIGAGAIGSSAIFWARRLGAQRIVSVTRSRRAESLVATLGADGLVQSGDALGERVADALGGAADLVIEAAGVRGALQQAAELVRIGGTVLSLGGCIVPDTILPLIAMVKEIRVQFSVAYGKGEFHDALAALGSGAVTPRAMIGETIGLDQLPQRFEAMRTGAHPAKVMVAPQQR